MEQYKGFWISGKAGLVHAFSSESYVAGDLQTRARELIEEVTRFALRSFTMPDQDLAAFSGSSWRG